jgi:hypothetical protein
MKSQNEFFDWEEGQPFWKQWVSFFLQNQPFAKVLNLFAPTRTEESQTIEEIVLFARNFRITTGNMWVKETSLKITDLFLIITFRSLSSKHLTGEIPSSIGNLVNLRKL